MRPLEKDGINLWLFQLLCYAIMIQEFQIDQFMTMGVDLWQTAATSWIEHIMSLLRMQYTGLTSYRHPGWNKINIGFVSILIASHRTIIAYLTCDTYIMQSSLAGWMDLSFSCNKHHLLIKHVPEFSIKRLIIIYSTRNLSSFDLNTHHRKIETYLFILGNNLKRIE